MSSVAEQHPPGLDLDLCHVWDNAVKTLKKLDAWSLDTRPLLKEYVFALREAQSAMDEGRNPDWDRAAKRASSLADQLALTPRGRKAAGIGCSDEEPDNEFAKVLSFQRQTA